MATNAKWHPDKNISSPDDEFAESTDDNFTEFRVCDFTFAISISQAVSTTIFPGLQHAADLGVRLPSRGFCIFFFSLDVHRFIQLV
ncbi:hypothetical protein L2E82_00487 [Cichorium intybus]|uniref:Uncharacterized protein n=1 Tax=Cichorium intybus TaxID=13427 RepID=A0ACB9GWL7_CICIN|nr:hypothetical protein L2E82_00487 [Cichorium intybus]